MTTKKTNSIMLTPEEIEQHLADINKRQSDYANDTEGNFKQEDMEALYLDGIHSIARAQAKKIKEEMEKPCPHGTLCADTSPAQKKDCSLCWQEAFKEVGE